MWAMRQRRPDNVSAGQMQRVALAGILAMHPRCIVFDEATAMLDPVGRKTVREFMRDLHHEGLTIITITHHMEETLDARVWWCWITDGLPWMGTRKMFSAPAMG